MKKAVLIFLPILWCGCTGRHHSIPGKVKDTSQDSSWQKSADQQTTNDIANEDDDAPTPTFAEVMADQLASYSKIEHLDTLIIYGKDSIHVLTTYYCLHDSSLVIPKSYMASYNLGPKNTKDFISNTFASKIVILDNRDTVFNKIIKKADFDNALSDQLKKYAIIFDSSFNGYNKATGEFKFGYSITIPTTDVGVPVSLVVNKNGKYHILDEYGKVK